MHCRPGIGNKIGVAKFQEIFPGNRCFHLMEMKIIPTDQISHFPAGPAVFCEMGGQGFPGDLKHGNERGNRLLGIPHQVDDTHIGQQGADSLNATGDQRHFLEQNLVRAGGVEMSLQTAVIIGHKFFPGFFRHEIDKNGIVHLRQEGKQQAKQGTEHAIHEHHFIGFRLFRPGLVNRLPALEAAIGNDI